MQKLEDRPPFVMFETRSTEDRDATIEKGCYVGIDEDFALITPAGSKDQIERKVSDWFAQLKINEAEGRVPASWVSYYQTAYKAFKEQKEIPVDGYPVINWPGLTPSQVKQLLSLNIRAVEDLALANEETIARLGMGGRALKQRAVDFLATAKDVGKAAEQTSALRAELEDAKRRSESLEAQNRTMQAQINALMTRVGIEGSDGAAGMPSAKSQGISADDLGLGSPL